jgi:hypothetical protein
MKLLKYGLIIAQIINGGAIILIDTLLMVLEQPKLEN